MVTVEQAARRRRLLLVMTGSVMAAYMPTWLTIIEDETECATRVLLTHSASEMVSSRALSALTRQVVSGPEWRSDQSTGAEHVVLAGWADLILVAPASMNFCAKLAAGICDDLASTTVHCATVPTVLVPCLPAACLGKPATRRVLRTLEQDGYRLAYGGKVTSATTGESEPGGPGTLPEVLAVLASLWPATQHPRAGGPPPPGDRREGNDEN